MTEIFALFVFVVPGFIPEYDDRIQSASSGGGLFGFLPGQIKSESAV